VRIRAKPNEDRNRDAPDSGKKITATVVGLLCATAWLTAILYFSVCDGILKASEISGIEVGYTCANYGSQDFSHRRA
jgi:hypothetical protein